MAVDALWHPQARQPVRSEDRVVITRGEGAYVWRDTGQRLLDATAGLWHANVGHGRHEIAAAVAAQLRTLETYHLFGRFANDRAIALADRVAGLGPIPDAKVFWTSGGSDAVDLACKLVRRYWQVVGRAGKRAILTREGSFHGLHAFGTSIGGLAANREGYGGVLVGDTHLLPRDDLAGAIRVIDQVGADQIAALVVEPVMGTGGVLGPQPGYLEGLAAACAERDILVVVDEVMNGFGRAGAWFASQRFALSPDLVLMAKGITSGYAPLGGVLIGARVWEPFYAADAPVFRHGLTFSGHAGACAAADANLDILAREGLVEQVAALIPMLAEALGTLAGHPRVVDVRAVPALVGGVVVDPALDAEEVARDCVERGVITRALPGGVLQVSPPFVVGDAELALITEVVEAALTAATPSRP